MLRYSLKIILDITTSIYYIPTYGGLNVKLQQESENGVYTGLFKIDVGKND